MALVAVSKTVPATRLRAAVAVGLTTLGENRVQELAGKAALLDGVDWHLIGHLQANKARLAVGLCSAIESVDSLDLARRLSRLSLEVRAPDAVRAPDEDRGPVGGPLPIYLQVNVDADPAKSGFVPAVLERDLSALCDLPGLRVAGLMTVGRLVAGAEEARPTFVALRDLSQRLRAREPRL
ncbi:MAG TPA: alanine racemase, partial [Candidatus Limnocylindrales bacterium]|nr:alanine racemase [Candidatus Limnocylindrales bacterium]